MSIKVNNIKTVEIAKDTYETTLSVESENFYFNSGQYIWVENKHAKRAFSVASGSNNQNEVKIIYRKGESNFKKSLIEEKILGLGISEGRGFMHFPDSSRKVTYLVSGVGIAPVISILETALNKKLKVNIDLFNFNVKKENQFYLDKLNNFKRNIPNFNLYNIVYDYKDGLDEIDKLDKNSDLMVIGNQIFVDVMYKILVNKKIDNNKIFFEENYPSVLKPELSFGLNSVYKLAVDHSASHTIITDSNGVVMYSNSAAEKMTGYSFSEMEGQTPRLWGGLMKKEVYDQMWKTIKIEKKNFTGELVNIRKDGTKYQVKATISPIIDKDNNLLGFVASEDDITTDKRNQEEALQISKLAVDRELKIIKLKEKIKEYEQ